MKYRLQVVFWLIVFGITTCCYLRSFIPEYKVSRNMYLLNGDVGIIDYELLSDNTMTCNLAAFSSIVNSMVDDGYTILRSLRTPEGIDIIMSKDDYKVRMYYQRDGSFTSIAVPYGKSYIPITYITEE